MSKEKQVKFPLPASHELRVAPESFGIGEKTTLCDMGLALGSLGLGEWSVWSDSCLVAGQLDAELSRGELHLHVRVRSSYKTYAVTLRISGPGLGKEHPGEDVWETERGEHLRRASRLHPSTSLNMRSILRVLEDELKIKALVEALY